MKRGWIGQGLVPGLIALVLIVGCTGEIDTEAASVVDSVSEEVENEEGTLGDVVFDQSLFSVEVTLPRDFFEDGTEEDFAEYVDEAGFSSGVINPDGSVTVKMSRGVHRQFLKDMKNGVDEYIAEAMAENPRDFTQITFDEDLTRFSVEVNRSVWPSTFESSFVGWGLAITGLYYQTFAGVSQLEREVVIEFVDASNGEVFDSQVWPGEE